MSWGTTHWCTGPRRRGPPRSRSSWASSAPRSSSGCPPPTSSSAWRSPGGRASSGAWCAAPSGGTAPRSWPRSSTSTRTGVGPCTTPSSFGTRPWRPWGTRSSWRPSCGPRRCTPLPGAAPIFTSSIIRPAGATISRLVGRPGAWRGGVYDRFRSKT